jgi:hypothetical protein
LEVAAGVRVTEAAERFGVFPDATWRRLIDNSGIERVDDPM